MSACLATNSQRFDPRRDFGLEDFKELLVSQNSETIPDINKAFLRIIIVTV